MHFTQVSVRRRDLWFLVYQFSLFISLRDIGCVIYWNVLSSRSFFLLLILFLHLYKKYGYNEVWCKVMLIEIASISVVIFVNMHMIIFEGNGAGLLGNCTVPFSNVRYDVFLDFSIASVVGIAMPAFAFQTRARCILIQIAMLQISCFPDPRHYLKCSADLHTNVSIILQPFCKIAIVIIFILDATRKWLNLQSSNFARIKMRSFALPTQFRVFLFKRVNLFFPQHNAVRIRHTFIKSRNWGICALCEMPRETSCDDETAFMQSISIRASLLADPRETASSRNYPLFLLPIPITLILHADRQASSLVCRWFVSQPFNFRR